jgi:hypothetical protein
MRIKSKDAKVGMIIESRSRKSILRIIAVPKITNKTIEIRTERIFPDPYFPVGGFFYRNHLETEIIVLDDYEISNQIRGIDHEKEKQEKR